MTTWLIGGNRDLATGPGLRAVSARLGAMAAVGAVYAVCGMTSMAAGQACGPAPTWTQIATLPAQITPRFSTAISSETTRNRVLLFGGIAPFPNLEQGDTWEYDGSSWTRVATTGPGARGGHRMAFDVQRARTVLYGGFGPGLPPVDETWEWNGSAWTQVFANEPSKRSGFALSYAGTFNGTGRTALYGGFGSVAGAATVFDETWIYDGVSWQQLAPVGTPPALDGVAMAFDPNRNRVVLFGGTDFDFNFYDQTWELDLSATPPTWTQVIAPGPEARAQHEMVFNAASGRVLLVGGTNGNQTLTDSWEFNGTSWVQVASQRPEISGPGGNTAIGFFQPTTGTGRAIQLTAAPSATYRLSGGSWVLDGTPILPALRDSALASDPANGRTLMFGGSNALNSAIGELWSFNGTQWSNLSVGLSGPRPARRESAALAVGGTPARAVLFGGFNETGPLNDTWIFANSAWTQIPTAPAGPGPRYGHALVFLANTGQTILFGGQDPDGTVLGDLWRFNGTTWSQVTATGGPGPRARYAAAYDPSSQQLVLFGGRDENFQPKNDTWGFNGTTWTLIASGGPLPRQSAALAYDAAVGRLVLVGGQDDQGQALNDTWTLVGNSWTRLDTPGPTIANPNSFGRSNLSAAWVPSLNRTIIFGGFDGEGLLGDTQGFAQAATLPAVVTVQPVGGDRFAGSTITLTGAATSTRPLISFQWRRDGQNLSNGQTPAGSSISGATSPSLTITSARPGDRGRYDLAITTDCGTVFSGVADIRINFCPGDFNRDSAVTVGDIFDYLAAFFSQDFSADFNFDGQVSVQDIFDFLSAWFAPCA